MKYLLPFLCLLLVVIGTASSQEYAFDSYQVMNQNRHQEGKVGGSWGHHLGHLVRTGSQGLWHVGDTGNDVNINPALLYSRLEGNRWVQKFTLANPPTIQQNTATLALGDTLFTYGLNISGGYIEEAVFDARTSTGSYNRRIRFTGASTNYIGAAISPGGTRVVWWTRVVNNGGPSDWVYMYNTGTGWSPSIVTQIPGNDFSYCFASFLNDTVFYVGGEVPSGAPPAWTFEAAAGKVTLGSPIEGFTKMKGPNIASNDIWVNRANGDAHLFVYGSYGSIGYFYKPANGVWSDTVTLVEGGSVSRFRLLDVPGDHLYMIVSQGGFKMIPIPRASITGKINFAGLPLIPLHAHQGFTASYGIWPEVREYQTAPVGGINFVYPGNDYDYASLIRHLHIFPNTTGEVRLRVSYPNGNETLTGKTTQGVYWYRDPSAGIDSVGIDYSTDGGTSWQVVAAKVRNSGSYLWAVPAQAATGCLLRVRSVKGAVAADTSDAPFAIAYIPPVLHLPVASISRPTKDTTVQAGIIFRFQGSGTDSDGYIVNYRWSMGDGRTVSGIARTVDHSYDLPGTYLARLEVEDNDFNWSVPDTVRITVLPSTGVGEKIPQPLVFALYASYPNPFNPETTITYSLDKRDAVRVRIVTITGAVAAELVQEEQGPGHYRIRWDGRDARGGTVPSGTYLVRLETPHGSRTHKLLLVR